MKLSSLEKQNNLGKKQKSRKKVLIIIEDFRYSKDAFHYTDCLSAARQYTYAKNGHLQFSHPQDSHDYVTWALAHAAKCRTVLFNIEKVRNLREKKSTKEEKTGAKFSLKI